MPNITLLPSAKVPLTYEGENTMTTEWYRFFWNVYGFTGDSSGGIPVNKGGTGYTSYSNGELLIGNSAGALTKATLTPGTGIGVVNGNGSIILNNTGILAVAAGTGIGVTTVAGVATVSNTGVTSVTGTAPIVSSGGSTPAISIADTAVTPGTYDFATLTVDQKGRLTAASSGSPLAGGINATITTAKLTVAGTNGSMTFTNGLLTAQTQAT